jgi:hypothetical protein
VYSSLEAQRTPVEQILDYSVRKPLFVKSFSEIFNNIFKSFEALVAHFLCEANALLRSTNCRPVEVDNAFGITLVHAHNRLPNPAFEGTGCVRGRKYWVKNLLVKKPMYFRLFYAICWIEHNFSL